MEPSGTPHAIISAFKKKIQLAKQNSNQLVSDFSNRIHFIFFHEYFVI